MFCLTFAFDYEPLVGSIAYQLLHADFYAVYSFSLLYMLVVVGAATSCCTLNPKDSQNCFKLVPVQEPTVFDKRLEYRILLRYHLVDGLPDEVILVVLLECLCRAIE